MTGSEVRKRCARVVSLCGLRRCLAFPLQEMFDGLAQIFEFEAIRSRDVVGRP